MGEEEKKKGNTSSSDALIAGLPVVAVVSPFLGPLGPLAFVAYTLGTLYVAAGDKTEEKKEDC